MEWLIYFYCFSVLFQLKNNNFVYAHIFGSLCRVVFNFKIFTEVPTFISYILYIVFPLYFVGRTDIET